MSRADESGRGRHRRVRRFTGASPAGPRRDSRSTCCEQVAPVSRGTHRRWPARTERSSTRRRRCSRRPTRPVIIAGGGARRRTGAELASARRGARRTGRLHGQRQGRHRRDASAVGRRVDRRTAHCRRPPPTATRCWSSARELGDSDLLGGRIRGRRHPMRCRPGAAQATAPPATRCSATRPRRLRRCSKALPERSPRGRTGGGDAAGRVPREAAADAGPYAELRPRSARRCPTDAVLADDDRRNYWASVHFLDVPRRGGFLPPRFAGLGYACPAAFGAAIGGPAHVRGARRRRAMYSIQELATAREHADCPVPS